jgi:hypothetical protein
LIALRYAGIVLSAFCLDAAAQQDYTVEELNRIGDNCLREADFQRCIDRALSTRPPRAAPAERSRPATPAVSPEPPLPAPAPRTEASRPADTKKESCAAAARYRDAELLAMWRVALEKTPKGRVFEEARAHLRDMRRETEQTMASADAVQVSLIVAQVVKLNADLIMDVLRYDPTLELDPIAQMVFEVYDRHRTIDDQVHGEFEKYAPSWLRDLLGRLHPKVKKALDVLLNYAENAVRLGKTAQEPSFRSELQRQIGNIDRLLAAHEKEIREGPVALRAINRVKAAIDKACGRRELPVQRLP